MTCRQGMALKSAAISPQIQQVEKSTVLSLKLPPTLPESLRLPLSPRASGPRPGGGLEVESMWATGAVSGANVFLICAATCTAACLALLDGTWM